MVIDLFESLGFIVNFHKSMIDPQQKMVYLGMIIGSNSLKFSLPSEKVTSTVKLCINALRQNKPWQVKLRNLTKIIGNLRFLPFPLLKANFVSYSPFSFQPKKTWTNMSLWLSRPWVTFNGGHLIWWPRTEKHFIHSTLILLFSQKRLFVVWAPCVTVTELQGHERMRTNQAI